MDEPVSLDALLTRLATEDLASIALADVFGVDEAVLEYRSGNPFLLRFFSQPEVLKELVDLSFSIQKPAGAAAPGDISSYKNSFIASEVLITESALTDEFVENPTLMDKVFDFVKCSPEDRDNILFANFCKVLFFLTKARQMSLLEQLESRENFLKEFLSHIACSSVEELISDIFAGIIQPDRMMMGQPNKALVLPELLEYLAREDILLLLAGAFAAHSASLGDRSAHDRDARNDVLAVSNVCAVVNRIADRVLTALSKHQHVPANLDPFRRPDVVAGFFDAAVARTGDNKLSCRFATIEAVKLMKSLLFTAHEHERFSRGDYHDYILPAPTRYHVDIDSFEAPMIPSFPQLLSILSGEPSYDSFDNTSGTVDKPLGKSKLEIIEFFLIFLKGSDETIEKLDEVGFLRILFDLFLASKWSNILHCTVTKCVNHILREGKEVTKKILFRGGLIQMLMKGWALNEDHVKTQDPQQSQSIGYMGSVIQLAVTVRWLLTEHAQQCAHFVDEPTRIAFLEFCATKLDEKLAVATAPLAGGPPGGAESSSSSSSDEDFEDPEGHGSPISDLEVSQLAESLSIGDTRALMEYAGLISSSEKSEVVVEEGNGDLLIPAEESDSEEEEEEEEEGGFGPTFPV